MQIRLHIDDSDQRNPRLIGLWLRGWSWILGGSRRGPVTVRATLVGEASADRLALEQLDAHQKSRACDGRTWPSDAAVLLPAASEAQEAQEAVARHAAHNASSVDALEIEKVLICSTGHITEEDSRLLNPDVQGLAVIDSKYGWLVRIPADSSDWQEAFAAVQAGPLSDAFAGLMSVAKTHNCNWLQLDCDGPIYVTLPKFEW